MEVLADENVDTEWVQALRDDGHDVVRVVDIEELGVSASDPSVLTAAAQRDRVLRTADQSDFSDPPIDDHPGIIIVADVTWTGGRFGVQSAGLNGRYRASPATSRTSATGCDPTTQNTSEQRPVPESVY